MKNTTLCYIEYNGKYLMMNRVTRPDDENFGKWVGIGGKVKTGETIEECLVREVFEETGITLTSYLKRGVIDFISDIYPEEIMHLYTSTVDSDFFISKTDEGILKWIPIEDVPNLPVWEGDRIFLDLLLNNSPEFSLKLIYNGDTLTDSELKMTADN